MSEPTSTRRSPGICVLVESFYPNIGGTERQVRLLAEDLARDGWAVTIVTRRTDGSLSPRETLGDASVRRIGPVGRGPLKKWGMMLTCLPSLVRLRRHYDLLYVPGFRVLGVPAVLVSTMFRKSCVFRAVSRGEMSGHFFDAGVERSRFGGLVSVLFKIALPLRNRLFRKVDALVAISAEIAEEYRASGVEERLILRIPNPVDTVRYCPVSGEEKRRLRQQLKLPEGRRLITYTGRLVKWKGLPSLLKAWEHLCGDMGDLLLVLVGEGSNDIDNCADELRRLCDEKGLRDSVLFTGRVENVHEYLQASDLFVFPTENEAFGIALIEAMACRLPVVSTAVGGVRDIVRDGENSLVVPPEEPKRLEEAIRRLLSDGALANRLAAGALETARLKFARPVVAAQYQALFTSLADRP